MDPNVALRDVQEALERGYQRDAREARTDLLNWLRAGGFAPDWTRYPRAARYCGIALETLGGAL